MLSGFLFEFSCHNLREGGSLAAPAYAAHALRRLQVMAPDEMDLHHQQKSGREEPEDTVQDRMRAKEQEISELTVEIRELREEIRGKEQEIRGKEQEIRGKEQEIRGVEKEIAIAARTEVRASLEAKLQFLRQQITSLREEITSLNQQIISREQQISSLWQEVSSLRSLRGAPASAGKIVDRSESWIRRMLLPQVPELPRSRADLTNVLFPAEQHQKLPVTKEFYRVVAVAMPELAAKFLIEADGSRLPCAVSYFLHIQRERPVTEMETTQLVASCLISFFDIFKMYSEHRFGLSLSFNSTEKRRHGHSQTTEARSWPDTIGVASGCTFLVGEYKVDDLHAAEAELKSKIEPLNPTFYGELEFIVGYIAAGTEVQWIYIGKNGYMHRISRPLNLWDLTGRCKFLLSLGYAFQLLRRMADSVPDVPGRRAMFSADESPSKRRIIYFYANKVVKHIRDFDSHSAEQGTSLSAIRRAYGAAEGCPFLLQAATGPTVTGHGTYTVECTPLGYSCSLTSEQEGRWMAWCVCQALRILHSAGLVHRDVRLPNIARVSETGFMLIDFESVADSPFELPEGFPHFSGWNPEMFEGNQYTPLSDMYSLGEVLDARLPDPRTPLAEEFVRKLTNKELSASDALQDAWLSEPML